MRTIPRAAATVLGVLVLLVATAGLASAHSRYVGSTPGASATVASAPSSVTVVFKNPIVAGSTGSVKDGSGRVVSTGAQVATSDPDRKTLVLALQPGLGQGVYEVGYVSSSEDGARVQGTFAFGVGAAVPASMATTESEVMGEDHDHGAAAPTHLPRTGGVPLAFLAGIGAALGGAGVLARRRATSAR